MRATAARRATKLTVRWVAGSIDLTNCERLKWLPEDLRASSLELAGTNLAFLPEAKDLALLWRGVRVPARVILAPETYPPASVVQEPNVEVRRVLMERLGLQRFLGILKAAKIDSDQDPGGPRELLRLSVPGEREPHVALHCRCPSTGRAYLLRVPPTIRTCHAAAAWLAGFDDPDEYAPLLET